MGCDTAQGYYFGRPMTENALIDAIIKWKPAGVAV
jgi:EAL domain-containing protein (putative c-di-GMP-specific phosphodiesterase class I)